MPKQDISSSILAQAIYRILSTKRTSDTMKCAAQIDQYMDDHPEVAKRVDAWSLCPMEPNDSADKLLDHFRKDAPPERCMLYSFALYNIVGFGVDFTVALGQVRTILRMGYYLALRDIEEDAKYENPLV